MLNPIVVAAVADHIAAYFSEDAAFWPRPTETDRGATVSVRWLPGDKTSDVTRLVEALRTRTAVPYRSLARPDAAAIVTESVDRPMDGAVTFWSDSRADDGPGVRYELTFSTSGDVWPGWFALRAI